MSEAAKKRRGRPPKRSDDVKSESILLRLDQSEKDGFSQAARIAGVPVSIWMRERLRTACRRELAGAGEPVPFLNQQ